MNGIIRLVAGGLLALACCYVGVLIKKRYKAREVFYATAREYAQNVIGELTYKKTPIPEIAFRFAEGRNGEFEKALRGSMENIKGGANFSEVASRLEPHFLKTAEKNELAAFFCELNKLTLSDQLAEVERYRAIFEEKAKKCEGETKKLGGMYFKLCALLGLALMLIIQ